MTWVWAAWPYLFAALGPIGAHQGGPVDAAACAINALLLPAAFFVVTAAHELGHAVVGRAVGGRVLRVQIGRGRPIAAFQLGETQVRFGLDPCGGLAWIAPPSERLVRLRGWLWTLGGPAATVGLLVALVALERPARAMPWVLGDGLLGEVSFVQLLASVSVVQLVHLLLSPSEGDDLAQLVRIPFRSAVAEEEAARFAADHQRAWELAQSERPDDVAEAVRIARRLHREYPSDPDVAGTYGTALVAAGDVAVGLRLLRGAYHDNLDDRLRAHNAAWIAVGESRRGRADEAARWKAEAERLDAECFPEG